MNAIKTKGCGYKYERINKRVTKTCLAMPALKDIVITADTGVIDPTAPVNATAGKNYANYLNIPETFAGAKVAIKTEGMTCTGGTVEHVERSCSFGSCASAYNAYYNNTPNLTVGATEEQFESGTFKLQTGNSTVQHLDFTESSSEFWPGYLEPMIDTTFPSVSPIKVSGIESALDGIAVAIRALNAWKTQVNSALNNNKGGGGGTKVDGHGIVWADDKGKLHAKRPKQHTRIVHMIPTSDEPLLYGDGEAGVLARDNLEQLVTIPNNIGFLTYSGSKSKAEFGLGTFWEAVSGGPGILIGTGSGTWTTLDARPNGGIFVYDGYTYRFANIPNDNIVVGETGGGVKALSGNGLVVLNSGAANPISIGEGYLKGTTTSVTWVAPAQCDTK